MPESIGYLFPGQGSQFVGMGKDLFDAVPSAKKIFQSADQILDYSISEICFSGPEEKLTRTCFAQPAIFVASIAALSSLKEKFPEIKPSFTAGLSLGEFTALVAAGSISFEEGLRLVKKRAEAMERCAAKYAGTMASILGLTPEQCQDLARESGSEVANLNSPDQIVLSGTKDAIDRACALAESRGAKRAIPLKVGGAFHSSLMKEAEEDLKQALAETSIRSPQSLFIPNAVGQPVSDPEEIRGLLAKQLTSPVRWIETMQGAATQKGTLFLEIGPGKVLKGLARKCSREIAVENIGTVDEIQKLEQLFTAA